MRLVPGSLSAIASAIGVDKGTVSRWRSGEKVPSTGLRSRLHALYAIDPDAWDRKPHGSEPAKSAPKSEPATSTESGLDLCERQLQRLHALVEDEGLVASERLKVEQLINAAVKTKEGIEQRAELLEARIVREHPTWRTILRGLVDVLRPYPQAAEAAAAWLGDLESNS